MNATERKRGTLPHMIVVLLATAVAGLVLVGSTSAAPTYVGGGGIDGPHLVYPEIGHVLTANPGTWQFTGPSSPFQYAWLSDGAPVGDGTATYTPGVSDVAKTISVRVTASDSTGSDTREFTYARMVWPSPGFTQPATIVGTPQPGNTLTADLSGFFIQHPEQPGPITNYLNWALCPVGLPITCGTTIPGTDSGTTAVAVTSDMVGMDIWLSYVATLPDGIGGEVRAETHTNVTVVAAPKPPAPPAQLSSTTNLSAGQVLSGTVHWTVQASGAAHSVKFYNNNIFLTEAVADSDNWAIDLDTTQFEDGVNQFGYDIFNAAGQRVYAGHHIPVTIQNVTPPVEPGPGAKLLVSGFAQTKARRGALFAVSLSVIRSDTGERVTGGKVACALAGKRLVWRGWDHEAARCRWAIPATAELGRIRGWIAVTVDGLTVKRWFSANVRSVRVGS